ncbi:hypothetical protein PB01_04305 [Psychrobacillus glaciei]|uniref:DUF5658 domain-containing protein n=1 Tax=Psychrobacillus glaciei TaxID=2283160 RepID=A0A5J6SJN3_9BACI|nr:hypothetical protein PB01_04305 [Psychrobacillus glaciei]
MHTKLVFNSNKTLFKAATFLLVLAILDTFFTDYGIRNDHITEANPLMHFVYETSIPSFYALKICLPLLLLFLLTKLKPNKYIPILLAFAIILYTFVLFQHLFWVTLLT